MKRSLILVLVFLAALGTVPVASWSQNQEPAGQPQEVVPQPEQPAAEAQPAEQQKEAGQGQLIMPGEGGAPSSGDATAAVPKQEGLSPEGIYTIKAGDTLWDISNAFLKDPFLWPLLWKANPYIKNPDLIYPGNKLTIPSLEPIERAMEQPGEPAGEKEKEVTEEQPPVAAAKPRPKPKPSPEEPAEGPRRPQLILPEEAPTPIVDRYAMINAGFVNEEESDDRIIGSQEPKTIFAYDDIVYIRIESRDDVQVGERFLIYRPMKNVKHPRTGSSFGRLIRPLGILQVTSVKPEEPVKARITLSFDAIEMDSLLTPYQEPSLVYEPPVKREKDLDGYILEVVDGRTINAQVDIVYLDLGEEEGVEPGDRFAVYAESQQNNMPRYVVGEVQVFLVKKNTSTAVVRKSTHPLLKGDEIASKK